MNKKYIIIGGVAGGASAAARLRRLDEKAKITVFERGQYISFANCGLPYYIGGMIKSSNHLVLQTPENFKKRFNIDVKIKTEIINIDRHEKKVEVHDLVTGRKYRQKYDKLVLAPGAMPIKPDIKGIDSIKIFTLRDIPDTVAISEYIGNNDVKHAAVIGSGFIGLEVAENMAKRGIKTFIVEFADHVLSVFDYDMAKFVQLTLEENGITLITGVSVDAFTEIDKGIQLEFSNGQNICVDIVVIGIGVIPEVTLAKKAGLGIGITGGIIVDERQQTTDKDIYAAGDAVEVDCLFGGKTLISLASPANRQGRIAADNIYGIASKYKKTLGVTIFKLFDMNFACAGLTEEHLTNRDVKYEKAYTRSFSHAKYYPDANLLTIKLIFGKKTGKIYGVQIVGKEGVDKRINVFATAMRAGLTADKLMDLELAHTPPFGVAKDPVNIVGYVASNIINNLSGMVQWHDIESLHNAVLLDVRTKPEYDSGTIMDALHISVDELRERIGELPKDKEIIVFSNTGQRGYTAERILKQRGFNVKNLAGGCSLYEIFNKNKAE
ncbi:MAG: FAD-dependent oxidoreductase [Christensenellales bacterium]|jgi:NADPH-dependent 2,4-dienoyl-CoA reductase/sulfur reductase-like enzyme/rhodanese-related sulfurtransferase